MQNEQMKKLVRTANDPDATAEERKAAREALAAKAASSSHRSGSEKRGFGVEAR